MCQKTNTSVQLNLVRQRVRKEPFLRAHFCWYLLNSFPEDKEEKGSQLKWVWKQIPLFEGEWGQEQGHVLWAINCLFCCPALIIFQRWQVSWGKSLFQMCAIAGGISVATDQKLLTVCNSVWRVHFQISSLNSSISVTGCNRRLPFRMKQEVVFKCCLDPQENKICCTCGWIKVAITLCQAEGLWLICPSSNMDNSLQTGGLNHSSAHSNESSLSTWDIFTEFMSSNWKFQLLSLYLSENLADTLGVGSCPMRGTAKRIQSHPRWWCPGTSLSFSAWGDKAPDKAKSFLKLFHSSDALWKKRPSSS